MAQNLALNGVIYDIAGNSYYTPLICSIKKLGGQSMITWQESNIERPKSLVQIAADAIRRGIILRELVLGQPLTEAGLAKTLGISKTPVREGLSLLRS